VSRSVRRTEPDIQTLRAALKNDRSVTLDVAALEIARLEYPDLDPDPYLSALDATAHGVAAVQGRRQDGPSFIAAANLCLFEQLAFRGNEAEYYDPRNSCLNEVLDLKLGIPITLAVVYIEVARRLRRPVFSVGLPGHFIVQYDDDSYSTFIDPFHQGRLLNLDDCAALARDIAASTSPRPVR
jgi:regulator of sirC expression with transglutaminase-like and TPR domain